MFQRVVSLLLWLGFAVAVAGYLYVTIPALRRHEPHDLLNAAIIQDASRIAKGQSPFQDPTGAPEVALMPGFPFVISAFVQIFDARAWEPRLLSLFVTLFAAALVGMVVRSETRSATLGAASAGFLLLGQLLGGGDPFAAGPESLALVLALTGCLALRYSLGITVAILAAVPFAAACFTHPSGLWFALAALFHLAACDRRRLVAYAITLLVLVGGGHVALSRELGPWFNYHAWDLSLRALRFAPVTLLRYLGTQLLGTFGVLTLGAVLSFAMPIRPWRGAVGLWTWMGFAALGAGIAATQSATGAADALRPAIVMLAILGPISIQRVTHHLSAWPGSSRLGGQGVVLTALTLQLLMLLSQMASAIPGLGA